MQDGFTATREIRAREGALCAASDTGGNGSVTMRVPVCAMTANVLVGDRERCISAGMDDYISKPLRAAQLVDLVRRVAT